MSDTLEGVAMEKSKLEVEEEGIGCRGEVERLMDMRARGVAGVGEDASCAKVGRGGVEGPAAG